MLRNQFCIVSFLRTKILPKNTEGSILVTGRLRKVTGLHFCNQDVFFNRSMKALMSTFDEKSISNKSEKLFLCNYEDTKCKFQFMDF